MVTRRTFLQVSAIGSIAAATGLPVMGKPVAAETTGWNLKLDGTWKFKPEQDLKTGVRPYDPSISDSDWPDIDVPNFWRPTYYWLWGQQEKASSNYSRLEMERVSKYEFDPYATRAGWYRRWVDVPSELKGKRFFLKFWAVAMIAEVWWNGQQVGSHLGMFGPFELEVSQSVRPGKNLLTVFVAGGRYAGRGDVDALKSRGVTVDVSSEWLDDMPQSVFFNSGKEGAGGIWQSVYLSASDAVRIEDVFFQPQLDGARIDVALHNGGQEAVERSLAYKITDYRTGAVLTEATQPLPVKMQSDERKSIVLELNRLNPKLWMPEDPNLYWLSVELREGTKKSDEYRHVVGFRTFSVRGTEFYLNEKPYYLRGATQSPYGLKPWDGELANRYFQLMKDGNQVISGFNETGGNDVWCQAANVVGIGIIDNGAWTWAFQGTTDPPRQLIDVWKKMHKEMLVSVRNHPCILARSINDEAWFHYMPPRGLGFDPVKGGYFDENTERRHRKWREVSEVVKLTRKLDPTRPIGASGGYARTAHEWAELEPLGIDDGDFDNIHVFNGTYGPSYLALNVKRDIEGRYSMGKRPLISDQAGTGYPDNDLGFAVDNYVDIVMSPQAWVGQYVYDERLSWQDINGQIIKEGYEKIRRDKTIIAGWLMFSNCQWFRNVYDAKTIKPYPKIYNLATRALEPILISLETPSRHFIKGEKTRTRIFVVHDDVRRQGLKQLRLRWNWLDDKGVKLESGETEIPSVEYHQTVTREIELPAPSRFEGSLIRGQLELELYSGRERLSYNQYSITLADQEWFRSRSLNNSPIIVFGNSPDLQQSFRQLGIAPTLQTNFSLSNVNPKSLLIITPAVDVHELSEKKKELLKFYEDGGVVLFQNPSALQAEFLGLLMEPIYLHFKQHIWDSPAGPWGAEYINLDKTHPLAIGLDPVFDMRWWNSSDEQHPRVSDNIFSLFKGQTGPPTIFGKKATVLSTYVAPHGYFNAPFDYKQLFERPVLLEVQDGKGMIVASTIRLAPDPLSHRFLKNLIHYMQSGDSNGTRTRYF